MCNAENRCSIFTQREWNPAIYITLNASIHNGFNDNPALQTCKQLRFPLISERTNMIQLPDNLEKMMEIKKRSALGRGRTKGDKH